MTAEDITLAEHYFQRAIELDPIFAGGYRGLALARLDAATQFQKYKLEIARASAETLAAQAIALDRTDAEARSAFAAVLLLGRGDHEGARTEAERALALTPRLASAHGVLGSVLTYSGEPAKGLVSLEMSIRLDPTHPLMAVRLQQVAAAHYFCGDHVAAIEAAKHAIHSYPRNPQIYRWLAAALVRLGRISEAKQALANVVAAAPASFDMYVRRRVPWMRPRDQANLLNDLAKAGWRYN
jgi:adenylate cyclase